MTLLASSDAPADLPASNAASRGYVRGFATALGRSLLPLLSVLALASTLWLGPWCALVLALLLWRGAGRYA